MAATLRRKSLSVEFKAADDGSFRGRLATLNVVDHDGDVTVAGAFPVGKAIVISSYQHGSWMGALPVGKGVIGANDAEAWVDGQFFLDTTGGLDTYRTVKALAASGQGEWSYGYDVLAGSTDKADLESFPGAKQILKSLGVYEASPVLVGAGINTGTEFIKSMTSPYADHAETVLAAVKGWIDRSRELAALRAKEGRVLSSTNRDRLSALLDAMSAASADISDLLTSTDPDAGKAGAEVEAIWLALQRDVSQQQFTD